MSAFKFVTVKTLKPHDGHRKGETFTLREDVADMQAGFGWVKVIGDAEGDGKLHRGAGTGSEASGDDGPEDGGSAG